MIKWDVKLGDPIEYFDPNLSYEITGYRPITEDKGLEFDVTPFIEAGQIKIKTNRYCPHPAGTKQHRDFWTEQHKRCRYGFESGGYRITGDHYFFLNFYKLQAVEGVVATGSGRDTTFPRFMQAQYEYFHYIAIAESLKKDVVTLKSRGVGWSEIQAAMASCKYTTTPKYISLFTAYYEDYLLGTGGVLTKCWDNLEYLNTDTEKGMRRLRQAVNTQFRKRQSLLDKEKNETGHMAEISAIIVDKPRKLRGTRVDRLFFEEAGSNENLTKLWIQSLALVSVQGNKFGTRIQFGTGGDTGPQLIGLEKMFFNPEAYNVLPYKHNYSKNGEYILSAYFVPQYACQVKFLDERGVTNKIAAKAYFEKEREKLLSDIEEYLVNCQEYCFTPEEQLSRQGVNSFNQVKLAQQRMEIEVYKTRPKPERGNFEWIKNGDGDVAGVKWVKSSTGKVLMLEPPVRDANNKVIQNLYVAGIDSIDHGVSDSVVGEKGSKFCALVKKRAFGNMGNKYVCLYLERPPQAKQQYEIAQQMLWFYSCKANLEDTKITFRAYLRERKWDHKMLMKRPQYGLESQGGRPRKSNSNLWGTPGSPKMIEHGLELITDYIEDFYENMDFLEMIDQLQRFSYENKGLFDIVSAMIMTEIGDEDMYNLKIKESQEERTTRKDIGYYIDERGIKRWGIVPTQQQNLNNKVCPPKAWRII